MPNKESITELKLKRFYDYADANGDSSNVIVLDSRQNTLLAFSYNSTLKKIFTETKKSNYLQDKTVELTIENTFICQSLKENLKRIKDAGFILWFQIKQEIVPKLNIKITMKMRPYITCYLNES